jgi:Uma2 family endonuclease
MSRPSHARAEPVGHASFEQYLALEARSQTRHEFVDGDLFAMAGGTDRHNRLAINILMQINAAAETNNCEVFISDMLIRTPEGMGYYPDLFVTCEEITEGVRFKCKPCLIVEVISESTEIIDRSEKLHHYRSIPSLQAYMLVSQNQSLVEIYRRLVDGTRRYENLEGGTAALPCIGIDLNVLDIYRNIHLSTPDQTSGES